MRLLAIILFLGFTFVSSLILYAQTEPQFVEIKVDDVTLVADYYRGPQDSPVILLLHMVDSNSSAWQPLIPSLLNAGYSVLAPDLRGHRRSGGTRDWQTAVRDIDAWLNWLSAQNNERIPVAIVGASIGGTLAILGCANNDECVTVIALSPPFESRGLSVQTALQRDLTDQAVLVVATRDDGDFAEDARRILEITQGETSVHIYRGSLHGTGMLVLPRLRDRVTANILSWLEDHFQELP